MGWRWEGAVQVGKGAVTCWKWASMDKGAFPSPAARDLPRICPWGYGGGCAETRLTTGLNHEGLGRCRD